MHQHLKHLIWILLLLAACEEWDLEQEDFVRVRLLQATATGLTTATAEAEALDLRIGQITDHGFIWMAGNGEPTVDFNDGKLSLGVKEPGQPPGFTAAITNLLPDTRYRLRAYAVVQAAITYSETAEIQTGTGSVLTEGITYEKGYQLQVSGRITGVEAGIFALSHGFCWSTEVSEPTLADEFVDLGPQRSGQPFAYDLGPLAHRTTYYIRAYARLSTNGVQEDHYGPVLAYTTDLKDAWIRREDLAPVDLAIPQYLFTIEGKAYLLFNAGSQLLKVYDPAVGSVEERPVTGVDFLNNENYYLYGFSIAGKGYVMDVAGRQVWQYDPAADQWAQQASLPAAEPLVRALVFAHENIAYYGLGYPYDDFLQERPGLGSNTWWTFDPNGQCGSGALPGCWTAAELPLTPRFGAAGLVAGGQAFLGLGQNNRPQPDGAVEVLLYTDWWAFDGASQTLTRKRDLPGAGFAASSVGAFTLNNRAYVLSATRQLWEYLPGTDTWMEKAPIPTLPNGGPVNVIATGNALLVGYFGFDIVPIWQYLPD